MDNWVIIKFFSYLRLRQSRVKQEVDMPQIQKCFTQYSFSILMLCAKYQEAGLCGYREKCDRNFVTPTTPQDDDA